MARLTGKARRAREIVKALRLLVPQVPMADAEEIREAAAAPYLASLPPSTAVWLATLPSGGPTGKFFRDRQEIAW